MPILPKTRLGPYEIQHLLGSGGMGEVYLANNLHLQRIAAIKIISEQLSQDPSARDRFQREARAVSKLSHPNICTIYDFGEWDGRQFLAMEYVDGQPLSKRLSRGSLLLEEVVDLFVQLASALESAHSHGIIHRDIKPANVLVTANNQIKVVDFGLAKQVILASRAVSAGYETVTAPWVLPGASLTHPGVAMGTVAYMSPEQARGEELDERSDLFSFGLVLYEAATGQRALAGDTTAEIFAALLLREPTPPLQVNPALPPKLGAIISKAIEKDKDLRYQRASDLLTDLRDLKRSVESGTLEYSVGQAAPRTPWKPMLAVAAVIVIALLGTIWLAWRSRTVSIEPPKPQRLTAASLDNPVFHSALSPDGTTAAYGDEFGIQLHLIATNENWTLRRAQSPSTGESWWPVAWFPDGNHLLANSAQTTHDGIKLAAWVVSTHSGAAVKLRDDCLAHSISPDGSQVAFTTGAPSMLEEIWVMGAQGEAARRIVGSQDFEKGDSFFSALRWSPDGRRIAFRKQETFTSRVVVASVAIEGGPPVALESDASHWGDFCWMPDGRLLFSEGEKDDWDDMNLWDLWPDPKSGAVRSARRRLTDWTDFRVEDLSLSRDGGRLTFNKTSSQKSVLIAHLNPNGQLDTTRRLTLDDHFNTPLAWTSDSKTIFFASERAGSFLILKQNVDETQANQLVTQRIATGPGRLTPDGASLLYLDYPAGANPRLMTVPASGGVSRRFEFNQQNLMGDEFDNVDCAKNPGTNCLAGTFDKPHHQHTFWNFDPSHPVLQRLFSIEYDLRKGFGWTLSPDGTRIATNQNYADHSEIEIYSLSGVLERRVRVNGFNRTFSVDWAPDELSWFVAVGTATGCSLLRVYPDGHNQVLLTMRSRGVAYTYGLPAPNGRELAIHGESFGGNVWMVDHLHELLKAQ